MRHSGLRTTGAKAVAVKAKEKWTDRRKTVGFSL